ncbi:MAG: DUF3025 domain-containing protein [Burkholderiales bacterium]|nr:MAG: DUF3025 domain-containing protein [Burkholderiales bacterium]
MSAAARLAAIDWQRPWLAPYRERGQAVAGSVMEGASVAQALDEALDAGGGTRLDAGALRFVPQSELPCGVAYESFVHRFAQVPTRDNLHDFFGGIVWLHHPALKREINQKHAREIERRGDRARRGEVRDALTLFDENGALIEAPDDLLELLRARRWHELFVHQRRRWVSQVRVTLVGHAILEKLVSPFKAITAHAVAVPPPRIPMDLSKAALMPLPVLGIPGWWADNEAPAFYDDTGVFRPQRENQASGIIAV